MILNKIVFLFFAIIPDIFADTEDVSESETFKIEGKVDVVSRKDKDWMSNTRVLVDGGTYLGFLRSDGSFVVNGVPHGSYVVEISNPNYVFEAMRVDITTKGKMRARKVNYVQPQLVKQLAYPLEYRERGKANYFMVREQLRMKDVIFSPMMMMMVLPLFLVMLVPKLMNPSDPETKKEMDAQFSAFNKKGSQMPDIAETFTSWFSGSKPKSTKTKAITGKSKPR